MDRPVISREERDTLLSQQQGDGAAPSMAQAAHALRGDRFRLHPLEVVASPLPFAAEMELGLAVLPDVEIRKSDSVP